MAAAPVPPVLPLCPACGGAGKVSVPLSAGDGPGHATDCSSCAGTGRKPRVVALRIGTPGQSYWNIVWSDIPGGMPPAPMRGGVFPKHHPVVMASGGMPGTDSLFVNSAGAKMDELRALGYWASCFPEGDGITFKPNDESRPPELVAQDFEKVFGWRVRR